jgi:hypothetical protein
MACKTETKKIGNHDYTVTQWPAQKAILVKLKMVKIFGASLLILANDKGKQKSKREQANGSETFSDSFNALFENSTPEELLKTMTDSILGIMCDGKRMTLSNFDEVFSGDSLLEMFLVFLFVMKVNFGNLMKGQLAEDFLAKMKENL